VREYSETEFASLLGEHFRALDPYGQNPCRDDRVRALTALARVTAPRIAARANGALDRVRYWRGGNASHRVQKVDRRSAYEYLVVVCSDQRTGVPE